MPTNFIMYVIHLNYVPSFWKISKVIMIRKPGKPMNKIKSYRPISILTTLSKLIERLFHKSFNSIITAREVISSYLSIPPLTIIERTFQEQKVCSAIFLDLSQAFDKVWHEGLITSFEWKCEDLFKFYRIREYRYFCVSCFSTHFWNQLKK